MKNLTKNLYGMHWLSIFIIKNGLILACGVLAISTYLVFINSNSNLVDLYQFKRAIEVAKVSLSLFAEAMIFGIGIEMIMKLRARKEEN